MRSPPRVLRIVAVLCAALLAPRQAAAFWIELSSSEFALDNLFSSVTSFTLEIEVVAPLQPGAYENPPLGDIEFRVVGSLDPSTPARSANSAFTGFAVEDREELSGQAFYAQGNALRFEIASDAELADGLQVSELAGSGIVFEFDGRELGTGRYHPPILQLRGDGSGSIRNAANTGGINPFTDVEVNASIGDEYDVSLGFDPASLTLVEAPEPPSAAVLAAAVAMLAAARRRRHR